MTEIKIQQIGLTADETQKKEELANQRIDQKEKKNTQSEAEGKKSAL